MIEIKALILGWLLGLLSPAIIEAIKNGHRRNKLKKGINAELLDRKGIMTALTWTINKHTGNLTNEFLDWFEKNGEISVATALTPALLTQLRAIPENNRYRLCYPNGNEGGGLGIIEYDLPLLNSHLHELIILDIETQGRLLGILKNLNMFNQLVLRLRSKLEMTFDSSITDTNHDRINHDLNEGYKTLAKRARTIVDLISEHLMIDV
jgi:hypothetical protein